MNEQASVKDLDAPVILTIPVQWGDQDAFHHVNNTRSIRWFESARMTYFDLQPIRQLIESTRVGPILVSIQCDYRRQLSYPDTVQITASIRKIGRTSMVMEHRVVSVTQQAVVSEGSSTLVLFDYAENKPLPVPEDLRKAIATLEGHSLESDA